MTKSQKSYRDIFKATSLFGGVQALNIIIAVIRSKFIAVLLGPTGMGISGLYYSTTDLISRLSNCGLGTSSVKNIAEAASTGDETRVRRVITVLRNLVWITGTFGLVVTLVLSPWLSQITFGTKEYTFGFIWISCTLLFNQLASGQLVLMQGLRKLEFLAKANLIGSVIGLIIIIPIYYYFRIEGIVPAIILISISSMVVTWFYSSKIRLKSQKITVKETFHEGKDMLKMGFLLSVSGLIALGASYLIRIFISRKGGVADVGLFNAGFAIINTYVGMVFTAMGTDYYPRLSAVSSDNDQTKKVINQQAEIAILILAPILSVFLVFINWVIIILYSNKFVGINEMIQWAAMGMYFKAISWSIAYILLAKGAGKIYFWNELISNIYILLFNILGYQFAGLEGLGISFFVGYVIYMIQVFFLSKKMYAFGFDKVFLKVISIQLILGIVCFLIVRTTIAPWNYLLGSVVVAISTLYSMNELEKRIGLKEVIMNQINRFLKR